MAKTFVNRALTKLCAIVLRLSALGLFGMTAIIGWQVFARFVLNASPAWTESSALLLMLYFVLFAAAVGVREGFHLGVRVLLDRFGEANRTRMLRVIDALVGVFGVLMMFNGARLASFTSDHVIPTLGISRAVAYWPFVACGALIFLFSLERVFTQVDGPGRVSSSNS